MYMIYLCTYKSNDENKELRSIQRLYTHTYKYTLETIQMLVHIYMHIIYACVCEYVQPQ